ncbi:MAG TPA: Ig-like domain-containing protein [Trinickia sp.]|uniref:Ig-like domain-containing protein n=1 Tax=Trinickia sp. TaxID=2571163 RepID=UPI002C711077|nr:Ig-like domain-containing protein [Trinickia sp.]HTI17975.1 Ig-like domain-containing protein [Trinickia sp.]
MANDLGGAAKSLYSLDSGTEGTTSLEQTALLTQDTAKAEAVSTDYSAHGAHIWITSDGKVGYDATHLDSAWVSNSFETLGYAQDSFTYAIRLGNGTLSWATAYIDIPPPAPAVTLAHDTGLSATDHITADGTLAISGVALGATVQYSRDNGENWSNSFSATEGLNSVEVRQIDASGNISATATLSFTLDTTAGAAPGVALATDSGRDATDHVTNVGTLALNGVETGATVEYSTDGGKSWTSSFTAQEGANTIEVRQTDLAGNVSAATSFSFTLDSTPPSNLSWSYSGKKLTISTDASDIWKVEVHDNTTSADYVATQQNGANWLLTQQGLNNHALTVTEWDIAGNTTISTHTAPAGASGSAINLALTAPSSHSTDLTVTIAGVPTGWQLSAGTDLGNGTWQVPTDNLSNLAVTPPSSFTGATVLTVTENWTNADGSHTSLTIADNVEAYATHSPIFAWSGDDHLTGSSGSDLFVFAQPIGNDTVRNFDVATDKIDLQGFAGITSFTDVQAHMADDANGNAVISLGAGETITVTGVRSADITGGNFVFDQDPVMTNSGVLTVSDGAMLPLGGTISNTGSIELASTGNGANLEILVKSATLEGGGRVTLSDDSHNVIFGGTPDATLINVDNTIAGAGQIGTGQLTLVNEGTIVASGTNALVIDTGSNVVVNTGTLQANGSGGLVIDSALSNAGQLWANHGNVVLQGDVTGNGTATISGAATLEFGAASTLNTTFSDGATGTLKLDQSGSFTGVVSGFSAGDTLDLADVLSNEHTTLTFAANDAGTGGTLNVSDGVHSVHIALQGTLSAAGFQFTHDQGSGTAVTYITPSLPHVQEY